MRSNKKQESYDDVENNVLCFFELFFISSRDKYQPSCIDNENNTEYCEKSIEKVKYLCNNTDSLRKIRFTDNTTTIYFSVNCVNQVFRHLNEEESYYSIDDCRFSFFELFLIPSSRNDDIKCINHHRDKPKCCKHLKEFYYRLKNLFPKRFSEASVNTSKQRNVKSTPYTIRYLHNKYTNRYPDNVSSPFLDVFITSWRKKKFQNSKYQKEYRNPDKEILDLKGYHKKCLLHSVSSETRRFEEDIIYLIYKVF